MKKKIAAIMLAALLLVMMAVPASASAGAGNVSGVIEQTWKSANTQIKDVVKGGDCLLRLPKARPV